MPFTCTLPDFDAEIFGETLTFPVGYDEVSSYSIGMGFDDLGTEGHVEFSFTLYRTNNETGMLLPITSGKIAKVLIPEKDDRSLILRAVCSAIPILLEQVRPDWILRITGDKNLPPEALVKHYEVAEAFKSCGYEEIPVKDRAGCKAWWMWNAQDNESLSVEE